MERFKAILSFLLILAASLSFGQARYVVHLKDKSNSPFEVSNPSEYLSNRAIERRTAQNIEITEEDLPVNPGYVDEIENTGAEVFFKSKWFNNVLVQATEAEVASIELLAFVDSVEFVAPGEKLKSNSRVGGLEDGEGTEALETDFQNNLIGVGELQNEGFLGEGVIIAFMDGGFLGVDNTSPFEHLFIDNKIKHQYNLVENDDNPFQYLQHGTQVLSAVVAQIPDSYKGVAPQADIMLFVTEDDSGSRPEFRIEEYNFLYATEMADSAGVDIINASVGYTMFDFDYMSYTYEQMDGNTTVITRAAEKAFTKGILVVTSAGNEGTSSWKHVTAPADGPNVLSVGSVESNLSKSSFSSFGPTADGRVKPDLMAYGRSAAVIGQNGSVGSNSGTSFASPQIAGLAALLWQKNPELTNKELFDLLLSLGSQSENPNNLFGHGIPNFTEGVTGITDLTEQEVVVHPNPFSGRIEIQGLKSGNVYTYSIIDSSGKMLRTGSLEVNHDESVTLDLVDLYSGIYILKVNGASDTSSIHRIVKY
ncbi:S8 family peptidase [Fulvivirga lutimaris]|uniref:S8 family peptidase n=1 Tax=Fulvivirga lutimaris TaxID=1819566 RepID=UPI0012BCE601|nr:S8 family peptidase [Fulvivirga lutimaris]MTI38508.1 T9SS type A sorting domain-containing protein [Fulvivirga lutimaris]